MNGAIGEINDVLEHGDRVVERTFEVTAAGVRLLVTSPGDQSPISRFYYSELEQLMQGFGLKLGREGMRRMQCDYRREHQQIPDPWLGVVDLDDVQ